MNRPRCARRATHRRRFGNATIEMVIAFQVLLWISMGMVEFGQYFYIKHAFVSAARDAVRAAILSTAAPSDPGTSATRTLSQANVTFSSGWMSITDLSNSSAVVSDVSTVPRGHTIQVTISTTYDAIPNVVRPLYSITGKGIKNGKPMTGQCAMVKE